MLHFTPGQLVPEIRIIDFGQATHFPVGLGDPPGSLKRHGVVRWDIPSIVRLLQSYLLPLTLPRSGYQKLLVVAARQRRTLGCMVRNVVVMQTVKRKNKIDELQNVVQNQNQNQNNNNNNHNNVVGGQDRAVVDENNNSRSNGRGAKRPSVFKQYYSIIKGYYRNQIRPGQEDANTVQHQLPHQNLSPDEQAWLQRRARPDPLHVVFHMLNDLQEQFKDSMTNAVLEATQPPNAKGLISGFPVPSLRPVIHFLRSITPAYMRPVVAGGIGVSAADIVEISRFRELILEPRRATALERFGANRNNGVFPTPHELAEWLDENNLATGVGLGGVRNPPPDAPKSWGMGVIVSRKGPGNLERVGVAGVLPAEACLNTMEKFRTSPVWDDSPEDEDPDYDDGFDDDEEEYEEEEEEEYVDEDGMVDEMDIDKPEDSGYAEVPKSYDSIL